MRSPGDARYTTLARAATAELEIKRSRFRCTVAPAADEEAARQLVEAARREHWDARHHCSAFVLGPDGRIQRSSDDGEPAGTAGMPMLQVLLGAELTDVVAVVTRWFGGTLLGAGGLVRAYSGAVSAALAEAPRLSYERRSLLALDVPHAEAGRLESELRRHGVSVVDVTYAAVARFTLGVAAPDRDRLGALVAQALGTDVALDDVGQDWVALPTDQ